MVSGLRPALRDSASAWSKATFSRPGRTPVSMTRTGRMSALSVPATL